MDISIVLRTKSGDVSAFTELYNHTHDKAYSVAYSILKDEFEAEDIVQEAYIVVMEKLDDLKNPDRFESWFYQIVRTRALNDLKKKRPTTFTSLESIDNPEIQFIDTLESDYKPFNPEATVDEAETRRLVRDMVFSLPEMQKKCILMRYQGDMKVCDIAKALNIPESTVKSNLNYGRKKIEESVRSLEQKGVKLYSISPTLVLPLLREVLYMGLAAAGSRDDDSSKRGSVLAEAGKEGIRVVVRRAIAAVCATFAIGGATVGLNSRQPASEPEPTAIVQQEKVPTPSAVITEPSESVPAAEAPAKLAERHIVPKGVAADSLISAWREGSFPSNIANTYRLPKLELGYGSNLAFQKWVRDAYEMLEMNLLYYDTTYRYSHGYDGDLRFDYAAERFGDVLAVMMTVNDYSTDGEHQLAIAYDLATGNKLTMDGLAEHSGLTREDIEEQIRWGLEQEWRLEDARYGNLPDVDEPRQELLNSDLWNAAEIVIDPKCEGMGLIDEAYASVTVVIPRNYHFAYNDDGTFSVNKSGGGEYRINLIVSANDFKSADPAASETVVSANPSPEYKVPKGVPADSLVSVWKEGSFPGDIPNTYRLPKLELGYGDDTAFRIWVSEIRKDAASNLNYYDTYVRSKYNFEGELRYDFVSERFGDVLVVMYTVNGYPTDFSRYSIAYDLATGDKLTLDGLVKYSGLTREYIEDQLYYDLQMDWEQDDKFYGELPRIDGIRQKILNKDLWNTTDILIKLPNESTQGSPEISMWIWYDYVIYSGRDMKTHAIHYSPNASKTISMLDIDVTVFKTP